MQKAHIFILNDDNDLHTRDVLKFLTKYKNTLISRGVMFDINALHPNNQHDQTTMENLKSRGVQGLPVAFFNNKIAYGTTNIVKLLSSGIKKQTMTHEQFVLKSLLKDDGKEEDEEKKWDDEYEKKKHEFTSRRTVKMEGDNQSFIANGRQTHEQIRNDDERERKEAFEHNRRVGQHRIMDTEEDDERKPRPKRDRIPSIFPSSGRRQTGFNSSAPSEDEMLRMHFESSIPTGEKHPNYDGDGEDGYY